MSTTLPSTVIDEWEFHEVLKEWRFGNARLPYVDPDFFFNIDGSVPFIYTSDDHIHYGTPGETHWETIDKSKELTQRYRPHTHSFSEPRQLAMEIFGDLLGRIGTFNGGRVCSFWNDEPDNYRDSLKKCIDRLISDGMLSPDDAISSPNHGTRALANIEYLRVHSPEPEEKEQLELAKRLHNLRGAEKKAAMKKLGVGWDEFAKHPMQKEMEKTGLINPGQKWWAPHSEAFNRQLDKVLKEWGLEDQEGGPAQLPMEWMNPDQFYSDLHVDSITFIFSRHGKLFASDDYDETHASLLNDNPELKMRSIDRMTRSDGIYASHLLGRVGYSKDWNEDGATINKGLYVSFWNTSKEVYDNLLVPCLKELLDKGYIDQSAIITTPRGSWKFTDIIDSGSTTDKELDQEELENVELAKRLHNLRGAEKKAAMKKLGVGWDEFVKHPMQKELEKTGLINPGQKWWAPHSESFQRKVMEI